MRRVRGWAALLLTGCAARAALPPAPSPVVHVLQSELDSTFAAPEFARAQWGVVVRSLHTGEVLYRRNADRLFMPASNQKLLTGAVALARLGADYRYRTSVVARGALRGDTLDGDLVVIGRGDPSLSQRAAGVPDPLAALRPWADSLRGRGIHTITGRVAGDASYFPGPVLGEGWMWDDLQDSYSAPVGALQFNEGFAVVTITPGALAGDSATVRLEPSGAPLLLFATVTTAPADSNISQIRWTRAFFSDSVPVTGRLSAGRQPMRLEIAVTDPTRYFERALTQALREAGIPVLERAAPPGGSIATLLSGTGSPAPATDTTCAGRDTYGAEPRGPGSDTLFTWLSPPLDSILKLLEKPSQNQIAEALVRTLGTLRQGGTASFDSGRAVLRETLTGWGIPEDAYVFADGSGLSRYNYVAPSVIAQVLVEMARHPRFTAFYDALPIAGVDGTIGARLRGTAAQGNVHAKTGSIANVRSLSGYVTTADGERLVFVLMANHFTTSRRVVERAQDFVVERLANFRRVPPFPAR
jgi:D-alanyl-D-alanine carboxypeptidase/D-alanyl-D-alanine-endopeptidase (penicillin-binding protein 4)